MRRIFLMRHAQAQLEKTVSRDRERPITLHGMHEIEAMRLKMHGAFQDIEMVICSNAKRTRQTFEGIRSLLPISTQIVYEDDLYHCSRDRLWHYIECLPPQLKTVMIIAHNPGIMQFTSECDQKEPLQHDFPTCGIAILETRFPQEWQSLTPNHLQVIRFIHP